MAFEENFLVSRSESRTILGRVLQVCASRGVRGGEGRDGVLSVTLSSVVL